MIGIAGWLLLATAAMGLGLGALVLMGEAAPRVPPWPGWLHGTTGIAGALSLMIALRGPERGAESGAGGFGAVAAWLLAAAVVAGVAIFWRRLRKRPAGAAIVAIHGMLGVSGVVMFLAWWSAG